MAQGKLKLSKKKGHRVTKRQRNPRARARKIIKPRKLNAREREVRKLRKKEIGRLYVSTEKSIAAKVGHLEILKGTRRELEENAKIKQEKQQKAQKK